MCFTAFGWSFRNISLFCSCLIDCHLVVDKDCIHPKCIFFHSFKSDSSNIVAFRESTLLVHKLWKEERTWNDGNAAKKSMYISGYNIVLYWKCRLLIGHEFSFKRNLDCQVFLSYNKKKDRKHEKQKKIMGKYKTLLYHSFSVWKHKFNSNPYQSTFHMQRFFT